MTWLNQNSGAVNAILACLLVFVTGAYVVLTARLVRENVAIREFMSRPILAMTTAVHEAHMNLTNLVIENWGNGPALQIRFTVRQGATRKGITKLSDIGFFRKGLTYLGPHQRIEFFLANSIGNLDLLKVQPLEITANYRDEASREWEQHFVLDFSELEGLSRVGEPPLYTIAKATEGLKSILGRLVDISGKVSVVNYSLRDLEREHAITVLELKLRELDDAGWQKLERFVDEQLGGSGGGA